MSERTSTLLEVVNRVREMNESSARLQGSPTCSPQSTSSHHLGFPSSAFVPRIKRDNSSSEINFVSPTLPPPSSSSANNGGGGGGEDMVSDDEQQPLDFSSKKIKRERVGCSPEYGLLGSDGHSDNSSNASGSSPHVSPKHHSATPSNLGSLTPTLLPLPTHSSTPNSTAATLNLLSVLQQQQQQQQQMPTNTPPYNPLLLAAAAAGNFSQSVVSQPPPVSNIQANLAELSKVSNESQESYQKFRESMLQKIEMTRPKGRRSSSGNNGFSPCNNNNSSNNNPLETSPHNHNHGGLKDDAYWERRKKNNEAAKRSRDARRNKENEVAVRAQFLEQENIQLKIELAQLRSEILNLRDEVYKNNGALESLQSS
ncbi:uncharacterized protein [Lepeophtheirus salmonis]|uniref:uncharacterized protein n=1 Tax=Lepeophtheirus salmonis TaxID=72036 RepID=UPI001AEA3B3F|nr:CAR1 transcription factor-like [Lepeophtheirus salmonis]